MIQMCPTILLSRRILKTSTNAEKNKCFYFILFYKEKTQTFQVYNSSIKGKKLTLLKCSGCATNSVLYCDFVLKIIPFAKGRAVKNYSISFKSFHPKLWII